MVNGAFYKQAIYIQSGRSTIKTNTWTIPYQLCFVICRKITALKHLPALNSSMF